MELRLCSFSSKHLSPTLPSAPAPLPPTILLDLYFTVSLTGPSIRLEWLDIDPLGSSCLSLSITGTIGSYCHTLLLCGYHGSHLTHTCAYTHTHTFSQRVSLCGTGWLLVSNLWSLCPSKYWYDIHAPIYLTSATIYSQGARLVQPMCNRRNFHKSANPRK